MQLRQIAHIQLTAQILSLTVTSACAQDWLSDDRALGYEAISTEQAGLDFASDQQATSENLFDLTELPPAAQLAEDEFGPPGEDRSPFRSKFYGMSEQKVHSQAGDWTQAGGLINLAAPISIAPEGGNIWLATGGVEYLTINTSAVLPDSQQPVPGELWKIEGGAMNFRDLDNGWSTGAILTIGSASDDPFAELRDMTVTAIGFLEIPWGERDAWNLSLFYSPTSQLPYPLPGIAYVWRPSENLKANIGIPFSLQYQPTKSVSLVASYFPLTNVDLLAKWQVSNVWNFYAGYQVVNESFWLANRIDEKELLYLFDQRLSLGLQRKLVGGLSIDFSAGYVFDRELFQADGFSENRRDEITIDPGFVGAAQLIWSL